LAAAVPVSFLDDDDDDENNIPFFSLFS